MPIIILEFENLYLSIYLMVEIATHPYTKWQKSRPIIRATNRHFLGAQGLDLAYIQTRDQLSIFWGFEFRKSVFLSTGHSCCIFWVLK